MACFLVSGGEAIVVTAVRAAVKAQSRADRETELRYLAEHGC